MSVRYGIIGTGMMGQEHIRNVALLDGARISAIADPDEGMRVEAAALAGAGVEAYADYRDLLSADGFDAIILASPNDTHFAALGDILASDKPILCEKPLCTTSGQCREIIAAASARRAPIWVAMEYRYMPPLARLLEELRAGAIGRPIMMAVREHRYPFLPKVGDWNRFSARTGGTMVEKCCHFWDLMRLTLDSDPVRVFASAGMDHNHLDESYDGVAPDIVDNGFVVVEFANGARGMLDLCMFGDGSHWQEVVSVTGPDGRLDAKVPRPARFARNGEEPPAQVVVSNRQSQRVETHEIFIDEAILSAGDHSGATYYQHQKFLEMVRGNTTAPEVGLEDGLWSVLVGEAAERSAKSGRAVELDELS